MTQQTTGTVFDLGYQGYKGAREGRDRSRVAVLKDGLRIALGLGRGGRAKILPWFFITILGGIGLIMALIAGAAERIAGPGATERIGLPTHPDFYGIASFVLFVFAALVAPELLCRDKREGVINLYLVRPLTSSDYLLARWGAFFIVMTCAAWLGQVILFMGLWNMFRGGSPNTSQMLMRARVIAQAIALAVMLGALFFFGRGNGG